MLKIILSTLILTLTTVSTFAQTCDSDRTQAIEWVQANAASINNSSDKITTTDGVTALDFGRKCLGDIVITYVCHFKDLKNLDIYNDKCPTSSQLTGDNFELLANNQNLEYIDFDYNSIKLDNLKRLNKLTKLKSLKLIGNNIGSQDVKLLTDLRTASITLGHNNWNMASIDDIVYFLSNTNISSVNFGGVSGIEELNELTPAVIPALDKISFLKGVEEIALPSALSSKTFVHLANLQKLKQLGFSKLSDFDHLDKLEENGILTKVDAYLSANVLPQLTNLKALEKVWINSLLLVDVNFYAESNVKKLMISERMINFSVLKELIRLNPEKIIAMNITSFLKSDEGKPKGVYEMAPELVKLCEPDQCFAYQYDDLIPLKDFLE